MTDALGRRTSVAILLLSAMGMSGCGAVLGVGEEKAMPAVALAVGVKRANVVRGGADVSIPVTLDMHGVVRPVKIEVGGLPSGVAVDPLTLTSSHGALTLHASADAELGPATISISSESASAKQEVTLLVQDPSGTVDATFGGPEGLRQGFHPSLSHVAPEGLVVGPDGRITLSGAVDSVTAGAIFLVRFTPDGTVEGTYEGAPSGAKDVGMSVNIGKDGRTRVAGFHADMSFHSFLLTAFTSETGLDSSFGDHGFVIDDVGATKTTPADAKAYSMAVQPDGAIVLGGLSHVFTQNPNYAAAVLRLLPNGEVDGSFGDAGATILPRTERDAISGLGVLGDGRIVASVEWGTGFAVIGMTPDGHLDQGFGKSGWSEDLPGVQTESSGRLAVQPDDKILVIGATPDTGSGSALSLVRMNPDGKLDASFGDQGVATAPLGHVDVVNEVLALTADGSIAALAGIKSGTDAMGRVVRFTPAGELDATFGDGGFADVPIKGAPTPQAITVDAYGRVLVAGSMDDPALANHRIAFVVRYWP
jgi:uncharacterized delta-60 repeat protein